MRPPVIASGALTLRTLGRHEEYAWRQLRQANRAWLEPWEATAPPGRTEAPVTFRSLVRRERRQWRDESAYPFVILHHDELVGRVSVAGVRWGAERGASIGYWISQSHAGKGIMPRAVALATEFSFSRGLHRIEIAVRPENGASLRVVEKLNFREEGLRYSYLHIDRAWRDHRVYALTQEEPRIGRYWSEGP
ncbi:GNAT family N-acetyltransferase [Demequina aestuarii]|uniref:GNAT family N-acetyltransferase n=1 Tax=Demequina aestuarii TaxID=327095 RepID=UPI000AFCA9CD|nr:GNAT family protein [Demequina aestuarii]